MNIFFDKIEHIKEKYRPKGILLIGSFVESYEKWEESNNEYIPKIKSDIDLFLIGATESFERSVSKYMGIEFDISFITIEELNYAVDKELDSLISLLAKSKIIESDCEIRDIINKIEKIYIKGPKIPNSYEIDYKRFVFTSKVNILGKIVDQLEFDIIFNEVLADLIRFKYHINGKWIPSEKRLLKFIEDSNILYILEEIYSSNNRLEKLELIKKLFNHIMEDFGGELKIWEKNPYPFDFE